MDRERAKLQLTILMMVIFVSVGLIPYMRMCLEDWFYEQIGGNNELLLAPFVVIPIVICCVLIAWFGAIPLFSLQHSILRYPVSLLFLILAAACFVVGNMTPTFDALGFSRDLALLLSIYIHVVMLAVFGALLPACLIIWLRRWQILREDQTRKNRPSSIVDLLSLMVIAAIVFAIYFQTRNEAIAGEDWKIILFGSLAYVLVGSFAMSFVMISMQWILSWRPNRCSRGLIIAMVLTIALPIIGWTIPFVFSQDVQDSIDYHPAVHVAVLSSTSWLGAAVPSIVVGLCLRLIGYRLLSARTIMAEGESQLA